MIPAMKGLFNERLVETFRTYSDIIGGQFYGHTHRDSIMVVLDKKGNSSIAAIHYNILFSMSPLI